MEFDGQYLTYEEYKLVGGMLDKMPFNLLEFEARKRIDNRTHNRLINLDAQLQEVKLCIKSLIDETVTYNKDSNVSSKSLDGWSITYNKPISNEEDRKLNNIIETYLIDCRLSDGTPYLYLG